MMVLFSANPLSLSVPEPAFETWLRDTGYLEILDETTAAHRRSSSASPPPSSSSAASSRITSSSQDFVSSGCSINRRHAGIRSSSIYSFVRTLVSILTLNPFTKLTAEDFSGNTTPWTVGGFIGGGGDQSYYSWPAGPSQAKMRVHENVKRYARNYASLSLLFFACSLYQIPMSVLGLISCLALWEGLRLCGDRWALEERYPTLRNALARVTQLVTAVVLYYCNFQLALFCAISISYAVMILHASFRKLMPSKQSTGTSRNKRLQQQKYKS